MKDRRIIHDLKRQGIVFYTGQRVNEACPECGKSFLSLYPLKECIDHKDLEEV